MNSIRVNILGKSFPLRVEEGEEELMHQIAAFVDEQFRVFKRELATQPEQTIMVLASLSIAEELFSVKCQLQVDQQNQPKKVKFHEEAIADVAHRLSQLLDDIKS